MSFLRGQSLFRGLFTFNVCNWGQIISLLYRGKLFIRGATIGGLLVPSHLVLSESNLNSLSVRLMSGVLTISENAFFPFSTFCHGSSRLALLSPLIPAPTTRGPEGSLFDVYTTSPPLLRTRVHSVYNQYIGTYL